MDLLIAFPTITPWGTILVRAKGAVQSKGRLHQTRGTGYGQVGNTPLFGQVTKSNPYPCPFTGDYDQLNC